MRMPRTRVSPGVLIGVIALVFAVTGAAVALPGKNSVDSGDIQRNAVKSKHIKNKAVKKADLARNAVPQQAYGRVNKSGAAVTVTAGGVGINGADDDGGGIICYDLAFTPKFGTASVVHESVIDPGSTVEVLVGAAAGEDCDAKSFTKTSTSGALADEDVFVHFVR